MDTGDGVQVVVQMDAGNHNHNHNNINNDQQQTRDEQKLTCTYNYKHPNTIFLVALHGKTYLNPKVPRSVELGGGGDGEGCETKHSKSAMDIPLPESQDGHETEQETEHTDIDEQTEQTNVDRINPDGEERDRQTTATGPESGMTHNHNHNHNNNNNDQQQTRDEQELTWTCNYKTNKQNTMAFGSFPKKKPTSIPRSQGQYS